MLDWKNQFSLDSKTILVTGASSGIGREIAVACAGMGAKLVLNGRNEARLCDVETSVCGEHMVLPADLTDFGNIPNLVSSMPRLNGVVLCAGISERIPTKQLNADVIDRIMNVNFKAPVFLVSELLRQKKIEKNGSVVFLASLGAESPSTGNGIYSASKGALISYAKCLMLELAPRQIRVNCISPGMVWTDLILDETTVTIEQLKEDEQKYPLKRYGKPQDIAGLALYLLSDASKWMTGSNLKITGGVY